MTMTRGSLLKQAPTAPVNDPPHESLHDVLDRMKHSEANRSEIAILTEGQDCKCDCVRHCHFVCQCLPAHPIRGCRLSACDVCDCGCTPGCGEYLGGLSAGLVKQHVLFKPSGHINWDRFTHYVKNSHWVFPGMAGEKKYEAPSPRTKLYPEQTSIPEPDVLMNAINYDMAHPVPN